MEKVQEAWKLGVTSLVQLRGGLTNEGGFFMQAAEHIKSLVMTQGYTANRLGT